MRILILEDSPIDAEMMELVLRKGGLVFTSRRVDTLDAFIRALEEFKPDVILSDYHLSGFDGLAALKIVRQTHPEMPMIMVTGALHDIEAVEFIHEGAKDYVLKDRLARLAPAVLRVLSEERSTRDRKAAEKALLQSEADLKALVEHSPIAMIVDVGVDADEQIIVMNKKFTELFGYTREDIPDVRHWWPLAYPDGEYREKVKAEWIRRAEKAIQNHGEIEPMEVTVTCKDGLKRYIRFSLASLGNRNIITFEDLTERKQAMEALHTSEKKLQAILDSSGVAIAWANEQGIIEYANSRFTAMFGYTLEDVPTVAQWYLRAYPDAAYREKTVALWEADIMNARRENASATPMELAVTCKDGSVRHVILAGSWAGSLLVASFSDISERRRAETELKTNLEQQRALNVKLADAQSQLLQSEKMSSLGQLAAGVAHELNNPIGFVHSNMGILEEYLSDIFLINDSYEDAEGSAGDNPVFERVHALKQEKDYAYIKQDVFKLMAESMDGLSRMRKIVQDLKDFSRVGEESWQWADLHQGLDSTLSIVWNELKYKCRVNKEYGALPKVYCMPPQLNQVFMNMLVNAGQAIREKGAITIRTGMQGDEVWVEVEDTGEGIPPELVKRIFEPFFTTKPVGVGTGLGLSLSYSIVQKHGGRIEVSSAVGKGTAMRVWLPVNHGGTRQLEAPSPGKPL